ncbi:MAG: RloB domain-containing protein [Bacteroidales bacterium]|nr:RloB domain-containing protein [Bacteroidales bacterium]MBR0300465.1 RloB domain-containing protein [Bacteroidales bacterium]
MITRRKNYTKQAPTRDARKLYIFCEGVGTEPSYFSFFEGLSTNLEIITVPPESGTDPLKLLELAKSKLLDDDSRFVMDYRANDSVWFVIDTDSWEKEGKITPLRAFCAENNTGFQEKFSEVKPYSAWNVVQSNPSFEIWLYYHFFKDCPNPDEVSSYPSFKAFVDGAISGGFDFQKDSVRVATAVENAKENFKCTSDGKPGLFSTEVYELAEVIIPFVRQHLDRLKGKMR